MKWRHHLLPMTTMLLMVPSLARAQEIDMYGQFGLTRDGAIGTAYVQFIQNYRPRGTVSGTMGLQIWATALPYVGGTLVGFKMAEADLGTLNGGFFVRDVYAAARITDPPPGTYNLVFVLAEWGGFSYLTVDWHNLGYETFARPTPTPVIDRTPPKLNIASPKRSSVTTKARRFTLRGTARDNVTPTRIQFKVRPPRGSYPKNWTTVSLPKGNAKTKGWSRRVNVNRKGDWAVQIRVLDARSNASPTRTIIIRRK
jgi:hypothetical protein